MMKSKFLSAVSVVAIALISTAHLSEAKVYTAAQFNVALKAKVGAKKGPAAYKAAASLYKAALGDKKNKKFAVTYTKALLKVLNKKVVKDSLQGKSRSTLAKALADGYFKGLAYNAQDSKFLTSLRLLSGRLPLSQRTTAVAMRIAAPVLNFNSKKGGSSAFTNTINDTIYNSVGVTPPPPES